INAFASREIEKSRTLRNPHHHKSSNNNREKLEYILTAVPNVGPKVARTLLESFGSLRAIFSANIDELMKVEGVGKKIASSIVEISEKEYKN
ncbi:MAG TPA: helix-hairpin-helix domain-containing protein, partial [Methanocorpusculum sp.]|nr:helix-hairpin-helix domain-containing protein [Methanocorpusculum sp.]